MRGTIYSKLLNSSEPIKWGQLWRLFRKLKTGHMWKHPVLCLVEGKSLSAPRPSGPQFPHEMIPLSQGFCEGCLTECLGKPLWTGKWCKDTNFFFFTFWVGLEIETKVDGPLFSQSSHQKGAITVWWPWCYPEGVFTELWLSRGCSEKDETGEIVGASLWSLVNCTKLYFVSAAELWKFSSKKNINQYVFGKLTG